MVEKFHSEFYERGYDLELIDDTWLLCGVPQVRNIVLGYLDFEDCLSQLMSSHSNQVPISTRLQRFFASKACRSAVMIGDSLTRPKMKSIVDQMGNLIQPWNCPHGRPTIRLLTILEEE